MRPFERTRPAMASWRSSAYIPVISTTSTWLHVVLHLC
jgi:hypothetical protein